MHRLRIQCQANGRGPKRRFSVAPRTHWSAEQWANELAKSPREGGLSAHVIDLDQQLLEREAHYSQ
eukprot:728865-Pyramimonas_sp.AAC.1